MGRTLLLVCMLLCLGCDRSGAQAPPNEVLQPGGSGGEGVSGTEKALQEGRPQAAGPGQQGPASPRTRPDRGLDPEKVAQLQQLGYLNGYAPPPEHVGVVKHEPKRVSPGLNFYTSGHAPTATLMTMGGEVFHQWTAPIREVFPDQRFEDRDAQASCFRAAYVYENLDLLAIYDGHGLVKLDKESNVIWATYNQAHHDLEVLPNGDIYVLTREKRAVSDVPGHAEIHDNAIVVLDAQGKVKKTVSLHDAAAGSLIEEVRQRETSPSPDIYHTNALRVLTEQGPLSPFAPGRAMISLRDMNALALVDLDEGAVTWTYRGPFSQQHDPTLLDNGNLLLFNNRGPNGRSQVLEINLRTEQVVWRYSGTDDDPFYSECCGTAQRLPGGNTLIAEAGDGRAIEVTPKGEIVWDFYIPERSVPEGFIATLFGIRRVDAKTFQPLRADTRG